MTPATGPGPDGDLSQISAAVVELARQVSELGDLAHRTSETDALVHSVAWGVQHELEDIKTALTQLNTRLNALEPASSATPSAVQAWVQYATSKQWSELAVWLDWLVTTYDLQPSHTVLPCWPAHPGAVEELAALHISWRQAATAGRAAKPTDAMAVWHERRLHPCLIRLREVYQIRGCEDKHRNPRPGKATEAVLLAAAVAARAPQP